MAGAVASTKGRRRGCLDADHDDGLWNAPVQARACQDWRPMVKAAGLVLVAGGVVWCESENVSRSIGDLQCELFVRSVKINSHLFFSPIFLLGAPYLYRERYPVGPGIPPGQIMWITDASAERAQRRDDGAREPPATIVAAGDHRRTRAPGEHVHQAESRPAV